AGDHRLALRKEGLHRPYDLRHDLHLALHRGALWPQTPRGARPQGERPPQRFPFLTWPSIPWWVRGVRSERGPGGPDRRRASTVLSSAPLPSLHRAAAIFSMSAFPLASAPWPGHTAIASSA